MLAICGFITVSDAPVSINAWTGSSRNSNPIALPSSSSGRVVLIKISICGPSRRSLLGFGRHPAEGRRSTVGMGDGIFGGDPVRTDRCAAPKPLADFLGVLLNSSCYPADSHCDVGKSFVLTRLTGDGPHVLGESLQFRERGPFPVARSEKHRNHTRLSALVTLDGAPHLPLIAVV